MLRMLSFIDIVIMSNSLWNVFQFVLLHSQLRQEKHTRASHDNRTRLMNRECITTQGNETEKKYQEIFIFVYFCASIKLDEQTKADIGCRLDPKRGLGNIQM